MSEPWRWNSFWTDWLVGSQNHGSLVNQAIKLLKNTKLACFNRTCLTLNFWPGSMAMNRLTFREVRNHSSFNGKGGGCKGRALVTSMTTPFSTVDDGLFKPYNNDSNAMADALQNKAHLVWKACESKPITEPNQGAIALSLKSQYTH